MLMKLASLQMSVMARPVRIWADDPALLAAAAQACGNWPATEAAVGPPIEITLEAVETPCVGAIEIAVDGMRLRLTGAGVYGRADALALTALCKVPLGLLEQPTRLAGEVIDTLLLFLLTRSGRVPLHAAGVLFGETAVLLAGASGSGKSTLSLAATARGLRILSDDTVYIQLQPRLRIWGLPRPIHVFPADAPGFIGETRLRAGKLKAAVAAQPWPEAPVAERAVVILLARGDEMRLEPVDPSVAARSLSRLEPGFDLLGRESAEAIAAVTQAGAWRLSLTRDPGAAIEALSDRFGVVSAAPARL
jgi:hypothetical protein